MIQKKEKEYSPELKEAIESTLSKNIGNDCEVLDISDAGIDAGKYLLHALVSNNQNPAGTTNLTPSKIKALARIKALNYWFKCPAIDNYRDDVINLRQSLTDHPESLLNLAGNLFRPLMQNRPDGALSRMSTFLRGRQ